MEIRSPLKVPKCDLTPLKFGSKKCPVFFFFYCSVFTEIQLNIFKLLVVL